MKKIAVLLTVHNRKEKTLNCLRNLYSQKIPEGFKLDVFLTDDGCTDGTPKAIQKEFPPVNIIKGDGNLFWNRGMYKAWEKAAQTFDYDYYLWLNDDTILLQNTIKYMIDESNQKPNSIIVGSTHAFSNKIKLTYGGIYKGRKTLVNGYLQRCESFNGNIVLIPKSVFYKLGNLDWVYQHAIGDLDYGLRASETGINIFISKDYRGICDNHPRPALWTQSSVPLKKRIKNFYSPLGYGQPGPLFYFNRKHYGIAKAILVWTSNHIRVFFPKLWNK